MCEKVLIEQKQHKKSTYPPPADGLCVPFFCNDRWWCKRCCRPSPLRVLWAVKHLHGVQGFAKKCSGAALRYGTAANFSGEEGVRFTRAAGAKPAGDGVFVFGTVRTRCESVITQPNNKAAVRPRLCGFPQYCGIAQHRHHSPTVSNDLEGAKKLQKGRRIAIFHAWAGKRVILVSKGSKRAGAPVALDSHVLPQRVISGKGKGNILFKLLFYWVW